MDGRGQAWSSCEDLANAMKDAFESFINVRQNKPAEYMAKFLDAQVTRHMYTATSTELSQAMTSYKRNCACDKLL